MTIKLAVSAFAIGLWCAPLQQTPFRSETLAVGIDVLVRRGNSAVSGLTANDFELRDNGILQKPEVTSVANVPIDISLVFAFGAYSLHTEAASYTADLEKVAQLLGPADRLQVVSNASEVHILAEMASPAEALQVGRDRIREMMQSDDPWHDPMKGSEDGAALLVALGNPLIEGRRRLVALFTTGNTSDGILDPDTVVEIAKAASTPIHVVLRPPFAAPGQSAIPPTPFPFELSRRSLTAAAVESGGEVYNSSDHVRQFKRILADFRQGYVLRYTFNGTQPRGWHSISVSVPSIPGARVRAKSGYFGR
jgi:hypothetical protein